MTIIYCTASSLTTGNMECITDEDANNIIINKNIDIEKYKKIYASIKYYKMK